MSPPPARHIIEVMFMSVLLGIAAVLGVVGLVVLVAGALAATMLERRS